MNNKGRKKGIVIAIIVIAVMLMILGTATLIILKKRASLQDNSASSESSKNDDASDMDKLGDTSTDKESADNLSDILEGSKGIEIGKSDTFLPAAKTNTVMIYMNGSNLESQAGAGSLDISEMLGSGVDTSKTNVVIFTGGASQWLIEVPSDKNCVMRVQGSKGLSIDGETSEIQNMGDANTLLGFLNFCAENYNTEHYALILWDHGAGPVYGYGVDELFNNDTMTFAELSAALSASPFGKDKKFDFVGFDACLMASLEYADLFADYADYMVASQEVEPGMGWDYSWLDTYNTTSDSEKVACSVVDAFGSYYNAHASLMKNPMYTLSCMDLSKVSSVNSAVNDMFGEMYKGLGNGQYNEIVQARDESLNCGSTAYGSKGEAIDQIDVGSIASEFGDLYSGSSDKINDALDSFIVKQSSNVEGTSGVSIYFPYSNQMFYQYYGENVVETISIGDNYTTFVQSFATAWESGGEDIASFYTELEETNEVQPEDVETPTDAPEENVETPTDAPEDTGEEPNPETPAQDVSGVEGEYIYSEEGLKIKLSAKQIMNMSSASYSILYKNQDSEYDDAYVPVLTDVKLIPDENGELKVPYDPKVIVAVNHGAETLWPFKQIDVKFGKTEIYRSLGQYLVSSMVDFPDTSLETVVCNLAIKDGKTPQILSFDDTSNSEIVGKNDVSPEGWGYMAYYAPTYLPVYDGKGKALPYSQWDRDGVFYLAYTSLGDDFSFETRKLSELDEEFICQVTIKDVKGNIHATNIVNFTRKPRTIASFATDEGSLGITVYGDHAVVNSYEGKDTDVVIPDNIDGVPVTSIDEDSFFNTDMKTVNIPEGVNNIGGHAFYNCKNLTEVSLPSTLQSIDESAFGQCGNLESINLPQSLEMIDNFAFDGCDKIKDITIPNGLTYFGYCSIPYTANVTMEAGEHYIYQNDAVFTADGKTLVECFCKEENYDVPAGTEIIGAQSFRENSKIKSVTLPEGVRLIDDGAFHSTPDVSLDEMTLPDSLEEIGDGAFGSFTMRESKTIKSIKIGPNLKTIGDDAFKGLKIESFEVDPNNEYYSSVDGFLTNKAQDGLIMAPYVSGNELTIPDGISSVYADDFNSLNESHVKKLVLSDSVMTIDAESLYGITDLYVGKKLRSIVGIGMLMSLENIDVSKDNRYYQVHDDVLYSYDLKEMLLYPISKTDKTFDIPEGVKSVRDDIFDKADSLKEVSIPSTLNDLGVEVGSTYGNAFSNAPSLEKITVNKKNKNFAAYKGLLYTKDGKELLAIPAAKSGKITVADGVETMAGGAGIYLEKATAIYLPDSLTTIRTGNFYKTNADVHIPDSVTYISSRTFVNAKNATIFGKKGSEAERIANEKGVTFKEEK